MRYNALVEVSPHFPRRPSGVPSASCAVWMAGLRHLRTCKNS